jgi:2-phospho-L-lactate guanylyltransferase
VITEAGGGLNPALRYAATVARCRWPGLGVAALSADLAALRPAELRLALRRAPAPGRSMVSDAAGTGTVLLTASQGLDLAPSFGPDSQRAHLASGAVDLTAPLGDDVRGLRRDVDTVDDLAAADQLGVGPATRAVLSFAPTRADAVTESTP